MPGCKERYTTWVTVIGGDSFGGTQRAETDVVYSSVSVQRSDCDLLGPYRVNVNALALCRLAQACSGVQFEVDDDVATVSSAGAGVGLAGVESAHAAVFGSRPAEERGIGRGDHSLHTPLATTPHLRRYIQVDGVCFK